MIGPEVNLDMQSESFSVRKLTPTIGAEIEGVDLTRTLSDQRIKEIHEALLENLVIFFRNQNLTPRAAQNLGPPLPASSISIPPCIGNS